MKNIIGALAIVSFFSCSSPQKGFESGLASQQNHSGAKLAIEQGVYTMAREYTVVSKELKLEGLRIYQASVMGMVSELRIHKAEGLQCDLRDGTHLELQKYWIFKPSSLSANVTCYAKKTPFMPKFEVIYVLANEDLRWSEINNIEKEALVSMSEDLEKNIWSPGLLAWVDLIGWLDEAQSIQQLEFSKADSKEMLSFSETDYFEVVEFKATEGMRCEVRTHNGSAIVDLSEARQSRLTWTQNDGKISCTASQAAKGWIRYLKLSAAKLKSSADSLSKSDDSIRNKIQDRFNRRNWFGLYRSTEFVQAESERANELYRSGALSLVKEEQKKGLSLLKKSKAKAQEKAKIQKELALAVSVVQSQTGEDAESDYFPKLISLKGFPYAASFQIKPTLWIWRGGEGITRFQDLRIKELGFDSELVQRPKNSKKYKNGLFAIGVSGHRFLEDSILLSSINPAEARGALKERVLKTCARQASGIRHILRQFSTDWDSSVQNEAAFASVRTDSAVKWIESLEKLKVDSSECGLDRSFGSFLYLKRTNRYRFCYESIKIKKNTKEMQAWRAAKIEVDYEATSLFGDWAETRTIDSKSGHPFFGMKKVETAKKYRRGLNQRCAETVSLFPEISKEGFAVLTR